jgi:hypothetical protein
MDRQCQTLFVLWRTQGKEGTAMTNTTHADQIEAMLRSHTERLLESIWGRSDLITDADDDYSFRIETSAAWVAAPPPFAASPAALESGEDAA